MAVSQNQRDLMLAATSPRILPYKIPADMVEGLPESLNLLLRITPSASAFIKNNTLGATTPSTITLTAEIPSTLIGNVTWTVIAGSGTFTTGGTRNAVCTVNGSSVSGQSITLRASVGGQNAQYTISKFGALAQNDIVNLTNQVTGQLANSNVSGLGALALLNVVNLNTQTVGALNGATQVTNLGALAYANAIAANQIGAGTLAAGVIYAGTINADNITSGTLTGRTFRTATTGERVQMDVSGTLAHRLRVFNASGVEVVRLGVGDDAPTQNFIRSPQPGSAGAALEIQNTSGGGRGLNSKTTNGYGAYGEAVGSGPNNIGVFGFANGTGSIGMRGQCSAGYGGAFIGGITDIVCDGGTLKLMPRSSFPSASTVGAGTIIVHTTHGVCFTDGTSWGKLTFTPV